MPNATTPPAPAGRLERWGAPAVLALVGAASLPPLWRALRLGAPLLGAPYPNDGLEGTLLHEARLVAAGQPLYRPLGRYDFVSAPYPPLHTWAVALADTLLPGPGAFTAGRLVSALAAAAIALLIVLIVRAVGRSWLAGLPAAALFLASPPVTLWATRIKPDMLAVAWAMLGLYCALRSLPAAGEPAPAWPSARWRWLAAAAAAFAAAFFTRQTTVVAAGAAGLGLLLDDVATWRAGGRDGRAWGTPLRWRTLGFGALLLGLWLGLWALADLLTAGQFTAHVWGLHRSEWWSLYLVQKYALRLTPYWPALPLLVPLLAWARSDARARALACYAVVAPATLLGAAEISANHNHLIESVLAISLVLGAALAWAARGWRWSALPALALCAILVGASYAPQPVYAGELRPPDPPLRFVEFVRGTPGEILADDVGLLIAGGKPVRYDDPSTMGPAARWGIWDQSGLLEEIRAKKFTAIMLRDDVAADPYDDVGRWTSEMRAAIREHYRLKFKDKIRIYVPKE